MTVEEAKTQQEINDREWHNPDNWSGPRWLSFYFSKRDHRTWVPKQIPALGWTLNIARPGGFIGLISLLVGLPLVVAGLAFI